MIRRWACLRHSALMLVLIAVTAGSASAAPFGDAAARPLSNLRFSDESGAAHSLDDFRGQPVLLHLWATWCVPCREELPSLDRLQGRLGGSAVQIIAVSLDESGATAARRFYTQQGLNRLRIYADPRGKLLQSAEIPGLPASLLIDAHGREVGRHLGALDWDAVDPSSLVPKPSAP